MKKMAGFGVAGNFAGHLEQAGEAESFRHVAVKESVAPKAVFPFYVPENPGFLSVYPLSSDTIVFPHLGDNLQIEPEVALICQVGYEEEKVRSLKPLHFGAYNDCSIRNPHARKISEKKNWGAQTKGISDVLIEMDRFEAGGIMDQFRIASFLERGGTLFEYGVDSPVCGYSYFHQKLIDWIIEKINHQKDEDPVEPILPLLKQAGFPEKIIISIGATRYTPYGEKNFLAPGDTSIVILYDGTLFSSADIYERIRSNRLKESGISALVQKVI